MKHVATAIKSKSMESGQLQDMLRTMRDKKVHVNHKGKNYGITDLVTDNGQAILLTEEGGEGIKASYLVRELQGMQGQDVFVEIDGKLFPAQKFSGGKVQAESQNGDDPLTDFPEDLVISKGPVKQSTLMKALQKIASLVGVSDPVATIVSDCYPLEEKNGVTRLYTGTELHGHQIALLTGPRAIEDGEIEINWGAGYVYVPIDDVEKELKKRFNIDLDVMDPSVLHVMDLYGKDPNSLDD